MSNIGISCDKKTRKIFLVTTKREEGNLKEVIFGKIDLPKGGNTFFQFDSINSWAVCEIKCSSRSKFRRIRRQLKKYLR